MVKDADELNSYWYSYHYRPHRYVAAPDEDYRVADQGVGSRKGRCGELLKGEKQSLLRAREPWWILPSLLHWNQC